MEAALPKLIRSMMSKPKAVHFGAGNIGRGFLGQLYYESGYHTVFVDVVDTVVRALNERGEYPIRVTDEESYTITVHDVSAINASDTETVAKAVSEAEIVSTAVGVDALPRVAPALAGGIAKRFANPDAPPLDVIICENLLNAGAFIRDEVRAVTPTDCQDVLEEKVGFVEASIGRMVPLSQPGSNDDLLAVNVEAYCELPVDANGFKGPIPAIRHLHPMENFDAYVERKLYVHNAGHAATAYLGHLTGYDFIYEAIRDKAIREAVEAALAESCAALAVKHGMDEAALKAHAEDLVRRFHNKALGDQITRVGKDPLRKLGPSDRLVGAANLCLEYGIQPKNLAFAVAAAIEYDHHSDAAAQELQHMRKLYGLPFILTQVCQIPEDSPLARYITEGLSRLQRDGWIQY